MDFLHILYFPKDLSKGKPFFADVDFFRFAGLTLTIATLDVLIHCDLSPVQKDQFMEKLRVFDRVKRTTDPESHFVFQVDVLDRSIRLDTMCFPTERMFQQWKARALVMCRVGQRPKYAI